MFLQKTNLLCSNIDDSLLKKGSYRDSIKKKLFQTLCSSVWSLDIILNFAMQEEKTTSYVTDDNQGIEDRKDIPEKLAIISTSYTT